MATLLIFLPLAAALLGYTGKTIKTSVILMFLNMFTAIYLFLSCDTSTPLLISFGTFMTNINYTLRLDAISLPVVTMAAIVSAVASLYILGYSRNKIHQNHFLRLNSLFTAFITYFICSDNIFAMCTGYGMSTIIAFFMLSFYEEKENVGNLAVNITALNFVSFVILLTVSAMLFNKTGSYNFEDILNILKTEKEHNLTYLIALAAFIMSGTFGPHILLNKIHKTSQIAIICLYSADFISAGLFLFGRFHIIFENNSHITDFILLYCSLSSILLSFESILQNDLKKTELLTVCSQISLVFLAFASKDTDTFINLIMYHGLSNTMYFMVAGAIIAIALNERNMLQLGGILPLAKKMFVLSVISFTFIILLPILLSQISVLKNIFFIQLAITANTFLTAFCVAKIIILVYLKKFRGSEDIFARIDKTPVSILCSISFMLIFIIYTLKYMTGNTIHTDLTLIYQLVSVMAGFYLSYRFNYRHTPSSKYEKVIDENRNIAFIRLFCTITFYKPAAFCYKIIDGKTIPYINNSLTSAILLFSHKIKKIKESSLFVYNMWIVICTIAAVVWILTGNGQ